MEIVQSFLHNRTWLAVSGLPIAGLSYLVVLALRVLSQIATLFGCKEACRYFAYSAKKFYAVYVHHNLYALKSSAPLPLLTYSKNIARREVIWNEEDRETSRRMKDAFLSQSPDKPHYQKLENAEIRGAKSKGICFGAARLFIRGCLEKNIQNEEELISYAKEFEEGFCKEAAALQWIYNKTADVRKDTQYLFELHDYLTMVLKIVGMKLTIASNWNDYVDLCLESERVRFDAQEVGCSSVEFTIGDEAHAVAYLKWSFGSYIFDSNKGLMKIGAYRPSDAICMIQNYYGSSSKVVVRKLTLLNSQ